MEEKREEAEKTVENKNFIKVNKGLLPLSWLYGLGVKFRNFLFETNVLKSRSYSTPVISVGNITVGGTGKTPHVEYLVRLLKDKMKTAVLSRGYKRKSKGFVLAKPDSTMADLGDEPFQMKRKFPEIMVAVDKKRTRGIDLLTSMPDHPEVIILDDAFQHRYVKPGINILLVDYHRLIIHDRLLPAGRLREPLTGKNRADIVMITKCPKELKPMEYRVLTKQMDIFPYQQLYFTTTDYEPLEPLFPEAPKAPTSIEGLNILLLTGIASPKQMHLDIERMKPASIISLTYGDHHAFRKKDIRQINQTFAALPSPSLIVTTEKDAARLISVEGLSEEVRQHIYALPLKITFMQDGENMFNENIIGYVRKNSRDSILAQGKDDNKSKNSNRPGDGTGTISFRDN